MKIEKMMSSLDVFFKNKENSDIPVLQACYIIRDKAKGDSDEHILEKIEFLRDASVKYKRVKVSNIQSEK